MKYCPACGAIVADDDLFCHHCGRYLRTCPRCNLEIPRDVPIEAKYCPECGQPLFELVPFPEIMKEIKWSAGDVFRVLILSILLPIPFVLLLSFVPAPFIGIFGRIFGMWSLLFAILSFHALLVIFTTYYVRKRGGNFREMGMRSATTKLIAMGVLLGIALPPLTAVLGFLTEPIIGSSPMSLSQNYLYLFV